MQHSLPVSLPDFLTVSFAARLLKRSEGAIREMARRGKLPCVRLSSGARVFERRTVERVAAELKNHAA